MGFHQTCQGSRALPSMGSIGDCHDLFEYLEMFHNRRQLHTVLGMLTLIEYELRHARIAPVD